MSQSDVLKQCIDSLAALGHLETVCSPSEPADASILRQVGEFLARYPFVTRDEGYVAFLRHYAGAGLKSKTDMLSVDIFGFSEAVTLHLLDGEGEPVEDGLLTFADLLIPLEPGRGLFVKTRGCGFAFPAESDLRWGVYRLEEGQRVWYCETFLGWLQRLVATKGRLLD